MQLLNFMISPRDTTHLYLLEKQIYKNVYIFTTFVNILVLFVNNVKLATRSSFNTQKENIYHQIAGASKNDQWQTNLFSLLQGCILNVQFLTPIQSEYYDDVSDSI